MARAHFEAVLADIAGKLHVDRDELRWAVKERLKALKKIQFSTTEMTDLDLEHVADQLHVWLHAFEENPPDLRPNLNLDKIIT